MSSTASFFAQIDRLGPKRHQQSQVLKDLKRQLRPLDRDGLIEFQRSFDAVIAELRTAELWAAATLILGPLSPHDLDPFLAWIACQGSHACQRVLKSPDSALEVLTRVGKRRRRPMFDEVLDLAWDLAGRYHDFDLYEAMGPATRALPPMLGEREDETQLWPHPATLEAAHPLLWQAFASKGIRLFPQIHDTRDVCACCGRVHAYAFGLISANGEPLGSYSLHWVEGEWTRLQSMVQLVEGDLYFGVEHSQRGNQSGTALLDVAEAPFVPEDGRYIGKDEALKHADFPLVASLAQLTLQADPLARPFHELWTRRARSAPALAEKLTRSGRSRPGREARCADCGEIHPDTEIACQVPDELLTISPWQARWRLDGSTPNEWLLDGRRRFRRGVVPVPVKSRTDPYCYGVWIEQLDPSAGTDVLDSKAKRERLMRGMRGLIANDLLFFPESTLGLEARIEPGPSGERPRFIVEDEQNGPLAREQRKGMSARRPQQLQGLLHT